MNINVRVARMTEGIEDFSKKFVRVGKNLHSDKKKTQGKAFSTSVRGGKSIYQTSRNTKERPTK